MFLNGNAITEPGSRGETITDMSFLLLFNAGDQDVSFTLPGPEAAGGWQVITDTAEPAGQEPGAGPARGRRRPSCPPAPRSRRPAPVR